MDRPTGWSLTVAVWIANVAVTVLAIRGLEHPKPYVPAVDVWHPSSEPTAKQVDYSNSELAASPVIEMPMATIVAGPQGRALMQGASHPSTNSPHPGH